MSVIRAATAACAASQDPFRTLLGNLSERGSRHVAYAGSIVLALYLSERLTPRARLALRRLDQQALTGLLAELGEHRADIATTQLVLERAYGAGL